MVEQRLTVVEGEQMKLEQQVEKVWETARKVLEIQENVTCADQDECFKQGKESLNPNAPEFTRSRSPITALNMAGLLVGRKPLEFYVCLKP